MAKIFVTRKLPGEALKELLSSGHEVGISLHDRPLTEEELTQKAKGMDALLTLLTDRIDSDLMDLAGPQLKIISNYAVGFDNVSIEAATHRGILVANTPSDEVNRAVAEHTWALLLSLSRRVVEADESTRRGGYKGWEPNIFLGTSLSGKTLGILGLGRIGSMVAEMGNGFNLKVLYYNRSRKEDIEKKLNLQYAPLEEIFAQSDFLSIHLPLTDETRGLLNASVFAKMKKGAYLINTARGPIVDEHDLAQALRDGRLSGAALDVFEEEPNINPELLSMENVVLTPHIASATYESREKMGEQAVGAILSALSGVKPENLVNPEVWNNRRT